MRPPLLAPRGCLAVAAAGLGDFTLTITCTDTEKSVSDTATITVRPFVALRTNQRDSLTGAHPRCRGRPRMDWGSEPGAALACRLA